MNQNPLVEIFCDGDEKIGYGHIRRSTALALYFRKNNIDVRLMGLSKAAKERLPSINDSDREANLVIFDAHEGLDQYILLAQNRNQVTVTLDWFGNTAPDINIVVYPHQEVKARICKYIGFDYIIIREEITNIEPFKLTEKASKVMICLGGGDVLNQGHDTAQYLSNNKFDVTLVQGPFAENLTKSNDFKLLINPINFPKLLTECDWVVTNGGGCFFEALYLGKPAFVLPQSDYELRIGQHAEKKMALLGIGIQNLKNFETKKMNEVVENGKKLIDGQGLSRITAIIKDLI